MPRSPAASRYQRLRQLRQKPARFIMSMFCTSVRSRRCSTRRRNAAASSSVRVFSSSCGAVMAGLLCLSEKRTCPNMACPVQLRHTAALAVEGKARPMVWDDTRARAALRTLFDAAVAAADPRKVLAKHLPPPPSGRCIVVGCGKSAAVMAAALEDAWPNVPLEGTVVTRYGHAVPTKAIEVIEASHPVPDANSERGARRLLERVQNLNADDLVLALISGGGSALCAAPAPGLTLADKQNINRALLASGANITEMNCLRKH